MANNTKLIDSGLELSCLMIFLILLRHEHDYRQENAKQVHSYGCRRCALALRLNGFKVQIACLLRNIESVIGDPTDKSGKPDSLIRAMISNETYQMK